MNKYMLITALALVLAAPAARAEYTGNGAISSSSSTSDDSHTAASEAKKSLKDSWDKFKADHAQTWDQLEAARRAHWHGVNLHNNNTATNTDAAASGSTAETASETSEASQSDNDPAIRPSKWETFKDNHQDTKAAIAEHAEAAKGHLEAAKDNARTDIQQWKDTHHDTIAAAKDKAEQWKDDHKDALEAAKKKLDAAREKLQSLHSRQE